MQYFLHSNKQLSTGGLAELTFLAGSSTVYLSGSFCSALLSRNTLCPFFNKGCISRVYS